MIKIYAAGNFVLMNSSKKERMFIDEVTKRTGKCNRLISFFFKKEMKTIMDIKNGIEERPKLIRRKKIKPIVKNFKLFVDGKMICSGLTLDEMQTRIDRYPHGTYYSVMNMDDSYAEEFIPF